MVFHFFPTVTTDAEIHQMSDMQIVQYCQGTGLLVRNMECTKGNCEKQMNLVTVTNRGKTNIIWRCGAFKCGGTKSIRDGGEWRRTAILSRDRASLWPLIEKHIAPGTTVISDGWRAYRGLETMGLPGPYRMYTHLWVNHEENFVDPITGAHTQTIESVWNRLRWEIIRTARSVRLHNLPKWLAVRWWRSQFQHPTKGPQKEIFERFLQLIANVYIYGDQ
jgi:hypothetical protein